MKEKCPVSNTPLEDWEMIVEITDTTAKQSMVRLAFQHCPECAPDVITSARAHFALQIENSIAVDTMDDSVLFTSHIVSGKVNNAFKKPKGLH